MRILLVAPQPFYSERGTPIAVRLLAATLAETGHSVDLLTYPYGEDIATGNITLLRCRRFPGVRHIPIGFSVSKLLTDLVLTASFIRLARKGGYDVIHAVEEAVYPALMLKRLHGAKVVYDMDSSIAEQLASYRLVPRALGRVLHAAERWAMRRADHVIAVCDDVAERAGPCKTADRIHVIPDVPVDADEDETVEPLSAFVGEDRPVALYVGNLEPYQGIDLLLETAERLPQDCNVAVVVVGGSEPRLSQYRRKLDERELSHRVYFVGPRSLGQLKGLLAQADVLLSPRITGGNTPLKIYSYMASGRPVLATRLNAHTQVLDDDRALLAGPEPAAFAAALLRLLGDADLRHALARRAEVVVRRDYSQSAFRRRVGDAYRAIEGRATSAREARVSGENLRRAN